MKDKAVSIIRVRDSPDEHGRTFIFNPEIAKYFQASEVADLPVAVISLAGVTKTGKSFFLTFLLRYAVARYVHNSAQQWLDDDVQLGGFEFSSSMAIRTSGMLMWPVFFECKRKDGTKICILLVDTQGTYDGEGSSTIWATIFAMSVLMSSLQIYNVEEEITEDDMQSLELYIGFTGLVRDLFASKKPGQNLLFLIRDFRMKDSYGYRFGLQGGNKYLRDVVFNYYVDEMHREVREHVNEAFDDIQCCCLPYPGRQVVESRNFEGKVKEVNSEFREAGARIVEYILDSENLVAKKVNGEVIKVRDLLEHFKQVADAFNKLELPTVVSPLRALADEDHQRAVDAAVNLYVAKMEAIGCTKSFVDFTWLRKTNDEAMAKAIRLFEKQLKVGQGDSITPMHVKKLHNVMINKYDEYRIQNKANLVAIYRELPVWSLGSLCIVHLFVDINKYSATKWLQLFLMARLFFWLGQYYRKRIFREYY